MSRERAARLTSMTPVARPRSLTRGNILQISSGIADLASGFASLAASSAEARQFRIQQTFDDLAISNAKLKASENAIFLREKFFKDVSASRASFAGRGVASGSGIGARFEIEANRVLQEDLKANELNSRSIKGSLEVSQSQAKLSEDTARNLGLMRAGKSFGKGAESLLTAFKTIK